MRSSAAAQLIMLTGATAGSGKSTLMQNLAKRCRQHGRNVVAVDEDAVWGRRRLDAAPVDVTTASPLFQQLLHHDRADGTSLEPAAVVAAFESLMSQALDRAAVWLQDWSWTDLLAMSGWDAELVARTSRRLREIAAAVSPRVVYLRVDPQQALSRALRQRGPVWFNRHTGRPVTALTVAEVAAVKRRTEPAGIEVLAGWPITWVDGAMGEQEVADTAWQELRVSTGD